MASGCPKASGRHAWPCRASSSSRPPPIEPGPRARIRRWPRSSGGSGPTTRSEGNFLWATFTRSNPAADLHGIDAFNHQKHWGCDGPLVVDARIKAHHAPPLVDDSEIERRVDAFGAPGGPLHGIL